MENIFLAIATEDKEYGRSLGLALLSVCRSFMIRLINPSQLEGDWRPFDLILMDERTSCAKEQIQVDKEYTEPISNIIYLSDRLEEEGHQSIYRYLPAPSMVPRIFDIYERLTGRQAVNIRTQEVNLYGFVSWAGGAGCTSAATAFGKELCRYFGKKVLYVSMEEIESSGNIFQCHEGVKNTGEYLYHMFKGDSPFLEGYMIQDDYGMESFAPVNGRNPLKNLDAEELIRFFSSIMDSGRFNVIIADIGNSLDEASAALMSIAEKLCMIKPGKHDAREVRYREFLKHRFGEEMVRKIVEFTMRKDTEEEAFTEKIRELAIKLTENLTLS